jgi:hypothetical protein
MPMKSIRNIARIAALGLVVTLPLVAAPSTAEAYQCKSTKVYADGTDNSRIKARKKARSTWIYSTKAQFGFPWAIWEYASSKSMKCTDTGSLYWCQVEAKPARIECHNLCERLRAQRLGRPWRAMAAFECSLAPAVAGASFFVADRHAKASLNQAPPGGVGAGEGNRTLVISLEGCCSTIELHPRSKTGNRCQKAEAPVKPAGSRVFVYRPAFDGGRGRTRTYEGIRQRIYSPPPLPLGTLSLRFARHSVAMPNKI